MNTNSNPTFILIDGSYFCFYRYYATQNWWKNAHPGEENPTESPLFVEKFKKTFIETVQQIPKKLSLDLESSNNQNSLPSNPLKMIVARDCKRESIWRNEFVENYKGTRVYNDGFMGGPFFKMAYEEQLFQQGGAEKDILYHPYLEADDCIALMVKQIQEFNPESMIYIIASDKDYLQLQSQHVKIMNLMYKNIAESKSSTGDAETDLFIKIIMGDVSDNIPSVFPKCGFKTALKCVQDKTFFEKKMAGKPEYREQYQRNEKVVSFECIPKNLEEEFKQQNCLNFYF